MNSFFYIVIFLLLGTSIIYAMLNRSRGVKFIIRMLLSAGTLSGFLLIWLKIFQDIVSENEIAGAYPAVFMYICGSIVLCTICLMIAGILTKGNYNSQIFKIAASAVTIILIALSTNCVISHYSDITELVAFIPVFLPMVVVLMAAALLNEKVTQEFKLLLIVSTVYLLFIIGEIVMMCITTYNDTKELILSNPQFILLAFIILLPPLMNLLTLMNAKKKEKQAN